MSFFDNEDVFSDKQAVTAAAKSTHKKDLRAARKISVGGPQLFVCVQVMEVMADTGSDSTITVTLEDDDNEAMSSPTARQTLGTFAATSPVGTRLVVPVNNQVALQRWIQLAYAPTGGDLSGGKFTAWLTTNPPGGWEALPQGSTGPTFL